MEKFAEKKETELLVEVEKYYEKCRESPNWIEYCIKHVGISDSTKSVIAQVVCRLPKEVKDFVCQKCLFVSVTDGRCLFKPCGNKDQWLIILSETLAPEALHVAIAHNIAFAWLQNDSVPNKITKECKNVEEHTLTMLTSWGLSTLQK